MPVFLDRSIPLGPALSLVLIGASLVLTVLDRRARTVNDCHARRENDALELGYRAGLQAR